MLSGGRRTAPARRSAAARRVLGRRAGLRARPGHVPRRLLPLRARRRSRSTSSSSRPRCDPDLVFTHYREDRHQDHRFVSELTYNTFRDHLVLEYEILKIDGDLGNPNVYVPLDAATVRRKIRLLTDCFGTQRDKRWFSEDAFRA